MMKAEVEGQDRGNVISSNDDYSPSCLRYERKSEAVSTNNLLGCLLNVFRAVPGIILWDAFGTLLPP
jgi:hypothetical protein